MLHNEGWKNSRVVDHLPTLFVPSSFLWVKFLTPRSLALRAVTVRTRSLAFLTVPLILYIVNSALNRRVQSMICESKLQDMLLQPIAGRSLELKIGLLAFRHFAHRFGARCW